MSRRRCSVETSTIDEKQIAPPVIVEIDDSDTVAGHLDDVFIGFYTAVDIGVNYARFRGDISRLNGRRRPTNFCLRGSLGNRLGGATHPLTECCACEASEKDEERPPSQRDQNDNFSAN
jgi:hypothetical protein